MLDPHLVGQGKPRTSRQHVAIIRAAIPAGKGHRGSLGGQQSQLCASRFGRGISQGCGRLTEIAGGAIVVKVWQVEHVPTLIGVANGQMELDHDQVGRD